MIGKTKLKNERKYQKKNERSKGKELKEYRKEEEGSVIKKKNEESKMNR